jgi:trk system potassium uptake protein TrkA
MAFMLVGYGRVGQRTADILQSEGHEFSIVEISPEKAAQAEENGFEVHVGDAEDERVLQQAGVAETDALAALTGDLNANFAACMIAKSHGCRTVLRIDEDYRQEIYEKYAADVDEIVYPERMGAAGAKTALLGGDLNVLADLTEHLTATTVTIPADSPHAGRRVVELQLPADARLYAHGSATEPLTIPMPKTVLHEGDRIAVIAERDALSAVRAMLDGDAVVS